MNELVWHLLFLGITLFQCLFMAIQWVTFQRKEYGYYIAYTIGMMCYILFRIEDAEKLFFIPVSRFANHLLDHTILVFSLWMYVRFGNYFLNLKKLQPNVYAHARRLEWVMVACMLLTVVAFFIITERFLLGYIFIGLLLIISAFALPLIVNLFRQKNMLNNFLVMGGLVLILGGMGGNIYNMLNHQVGKQSLNVFVGMELGVLAELLLLNTGFMLKNKILQQQVIKTQQQLLKKYEDEKSRS
jgi:hypothetical protein